MTIGWTKNLKQSKICWIFYFWKFEEVKKPCVRHLDHGRACSKLSLIKRKPHNFPSPLYIYIYIYTHIHTIVSGITFLNFNPNWIDHKWSILLLKKKKKKKGLYSILHTFFFIYIYIYIYLYIYIHILLCQGLPF